MSADSNDGGHADGLLADAEDGRDGLADQSLPEEASNEVAFGGTRFVPIAGGFAGILPYSERDVGGTITKVVSARDLHELLRVADVFPTWIERAIARLGLERDIDYVRDTFKGTGSCRRVRQYFLTERAARVIVFAVNPPVGVAVRNHLRAVLSAERGEVEKSGSDQVASGGVSAAEDVVESGLVSGSEVEIAAEVVLEPGEPESSRISGNELPEEKAIDGVEQETPAVDVNVDQGTSSISSKFDGPWFGPEGDVSGRLVGMMPCQGGSSVSLEDAFVGPVLEFRGVLIRTFRAGGRIWFVVEDLCGSVGCPAYGVLADMDIALDDRCFFEMPDWAICWCALSANGARRFALKLWTRESQALYLWLEDEAIPALVHTENVETMQKNKAASADLGDGQGKEPVAPSFVCSPATLPLSMEEFLQVMGVPETMAREEAVVREADLALDVMGHGVEAAGFRHPATGAWLFHRSILVEWWAKAAATVSSSIRSRFS